MHQKSQRVNLKKERKENGSEGAAIVIHGMASFLSWSKSICNPETCITRIRRAFGKLKPPFEEGEHLEQAWTMPASTYRFQGRAPSFPHSWLKTYGSPR